MEWSSNDIEQQNQLHGEERNAIVSVHRPANGSVSWLKAMTDEQMETLRKQIAVYGSLCEQLVEMHKACAAQHDLAGVRLGSGYNDSPMTPGGHRISARQRWTPTPIQLQILERIFEQGNGTPSKQKIKEITTELSRHGQISETNVYNWFQNRRARSKRKQMVLSSSVADSEVDTEVDSFSEKKMVSQLFFSQHSHSRSEEICFQAHEMSSDIYYLEDDRLTVGLGMAGSYNFYDQAEEYGMAG